MQNVKVTIKKITGYEWIDRACEFTSGKHVTINPSKMYRAEHSPIRTQLFAVNMYNIPTYVSVHFARHKIGVEHFVKSNRRANEPVDRNTPVHHMMFINAHALINMARARLCRKADEETRNIMMQIKKELETADKALYGYLVPNCEYRRSCPELSPCKYREVK